MPDVHIHTARDTGSVKTIEERLEQVFPKGSFFLKNPEGSNARSDQSVETFRGDWAKRLGKTADDFKDAASKKQTVRIKASNDVETIKKNLAEAIGIPNAAIVMQKPDGSVSKTNIKLSTFRGYWSGK